MHATRLELGRLSECQKHMLSEEGHPLQDKPRHMLLNFGYPLGADVLNMPRPLNNHIYIYDYHKFALLLELLMFGASMGFGSSLNDHITSVVISAAYNKYDFKFSFTCYYTPTQLLRL